MKRDIQLPAERESQRETVAQEIVQIVLQAARSDALTSSKASVALAQINNSNTNLIASKTDELNKTLTQAAAALGAGGLTIKRRRAMARALPQADRLGAWRSACATVDAANSTSAERAATHAMLGIELLARGKEPEARHEINTSLDIDPTTDESRMGHALLLGIDGKHSEAHSVLDSVSSSDVAYRSIRAQLLLFEGRHADLAETATTPDLTEQEVIGVRRARAMSMMQQGQFKDALSLLTNSTLPEDIALRSTCTCAQLSIRLSTGIDRQQLRNEIEAARQLATEARMAATSAASSILATNATIEIADCEQLLGNELVARKLLEEVGIPDSPELLIRAAYVRAKMKDWAIASMLLSHAAELALPHALFELELLTMQVGDGELARIQELATRRFGDHLPAEADALISAAFFRAGRVEEASRRTHAAMQATPDSVELQILYSRILLHTGKAEAAKEQLASAAMRASTPATAAEIAELALQLDPQIAVNVLQQIGVNQSSSPGLIRILAFALSQLRTNTADQAISELARQRPDIPVVSKLWARALIEQGDTRRALEVLQPFAFDLDVGLQICSILVQENMTHEAAELLKKLPPVSTPDDLLALSKMHLLCGDHKASIDCASRALISLPSDVDIAFGYFGIFMEASRHIESTLAPDRAQPGTVATLLQGQVETQIHYSTTKAAFPGTKQTTRGSPLARAIHGQSSGSTIQWTDESGTHDAILTEIRDERVYLLHWSRDLLEGDPRLVAIPLEPDFSSLAEIVNARHKTLEFVLSVAAKRPVPQHQLAELLGMDLAQLRGLLASRPDCGLRVATNAKTIDIAHHKLILDTGTLLSFLEMEQFGTLKASGLAAETTSFSLVDLTQMQTQREASLSRGGGYLSPEPDGGISYSERPKDDPMVRHLRQALQVVESFLVVVAPSTRFSKDEEELASLFGRSTIAAAKWAQETGAILVVDDAVAAVTLRNHYSIEILGAIDVVRHLAILNGRPLEGAKAAIGMFMRGTRDFAPTGDELACAIHNDPALFDWWTGVFAKLVNSGFSNTALLALTTDFLNALSRHESVSTAEESLVSILFGLLFHRRGISANVPVKLALRRSLLRLPFHERLERLAETASVNVLAS